MSCNVNDSGKVHGIRIMKLVTYELYYEFQQDGQFLQSSEATKASKGDI